jgi:hypothetical protein
LMLINFQKRPEGGRLGAGQRLVDRARGSG